MMLNIECGSKSVLIGHFRYKITDELDEFDLPCYFFKAYFNNIPKSTIKIYKEFDGDKLNCIHYWTAANSKNFSKKYIILKGDFKNMRLKNILTAFIKIDQVSII